MRVRPIQLPHLGPRDPFPPIEQALPPHCAAPGLLASGGALDVATLCDAYQHAIFPWFSKGQPILWWSTDPRMVLDTSAFKLHRSLRQTLHKFKASARCEIRFDSAFNEVINACASSVRPGQRAGEAGTWIVADMVEAYCALHRAGFAHSVETWVDGQLVGGLYCVALGRAVFGESMFTRVPDASKIALTALVCFCRRHAIELIDCQQNTAHLASLGAAQMPRAAFAARVKTASAQAAPHWHFDPLYWRELMPPRHLLSPLQSTGRTP